MIEIEESLEVKNNVLTVNSAFIECIFEDEKGNKHSRLMQVDLNTVDVDNAVKSNDLLKQFNQ